MTLTPEVIGRDLTAKVEKVMRARRMTWAETILFLISEVVSPSAQGSARRKTSKATATNFFGREVVSPAAP